MIVAITGATGFIGRRLASRHVAAGDTVRTLSRKPPGVSGYRWYEGDLNGDVETLANFTQGADVLYHCAGEVRDQARMVATNVDGTRNLLRAASGRIGRWVGLSSVGVYGLFRQGVVSEDTTPHPQGVYENSKAEADRLVMEGAGNGSYAHTLLRPSIVYGPGMPNRSLFQLISMVDRGWFFFIGSRGASANYVHVDNVVEALMLCATRGEAVGRVYNLSDWSTIEDFVGWICACLDRPPPRLRIPEDLARLVARAAVPFRRFPLTLSRVDALTSRASYPSARIETELGYRVLRPLELGVADVVEEWRAQR